MHVSSSRFCIVTPCSGDPCSNGGTCSVSSSNYQCTCANGFSGTNCEGSYVEKLLNIEKKV